MNIELYRIFFADFLEGSKRAAAYAKVLDASEYLDHWLGRYGSTEELQQLVKELAGNSQYLKIAKENHLEKTVPQTAEQENRKESYLDRSWDYVKFCAPRSLLRKNTWKTKIVSLIYIRIKTIRLLRRCLPGIQRQR